MPNLLTQKQVEDLAFEIGFTRDNARIASAIAMCEAPYLSNGEAFSDFSAIGDQALANATWGYSYGGFQIRSLRADKGSGKIRDELALPDPSFNAYAARRIKLAAGSFSPWSTYVGGQYKAYLQDIFPPPPGSYVVVAGDSLSKIAQKLGNRFTWQDLARTNGLHNPYTVYIGQVLLLPFASVGV